MLSVHQHLEGSRRQLVTGWWLKRVFISVFSPCVSFLMSHIALFLGTWQWHLHCGWLYLLKGILFFSFGMICKEGETAFSSEIKGPNSSGSIGRCFQSCFTQQALAMQMRSVFLNQVKGSLVKILPLFIKQLSACDHRHGDLKNHFLLLLGRWLPPSHWS